MKQFFSKDEDCAVLAIRIRKNLGDKASLYGDIYNELGEGKYFSSYRVDNENTLVSNNYLKFYYKTSKDEFLRLQVASGLKASSLGERLACLSDFYEMLKKFYGEPSFFFTTDKDDTLTLEWCFTDKEESINAIKNGSYIDDAKITNYIVFGEKEIEGVILSNTTRKLISNQFGLPIEFLPLIDEDIENYFLHKTGKEFTQEDDCLLRKSRKTR